MGQVLRYDADRNGVILYGPYLKYNFLSRPYSFSLSAFKKSDLSLQIERKKGRDALVARWPSSFMSSGKISLYDFKSKRFLKRSISSNQKQGVEKYITFELPFEQKRFSQKAKKGIHFCIENQESDGYEIEVCSDKLKFNGNLFQPVRKSDKVLVLMNGLKVPTNAQISIAPNQEAIDLLVKFQSGFKIRLEEPVYKLKKDQLVVDSENSQVFIQHKNLIKPESSASLGKTLKNAFREKNYILEKNSHLKHYSRAVGEEEMEFSPFREGRSLQLFILSFPEVPSQAVPVKIETEKQIGTYSRKISLNVRKSKNIDLVGSSGQSMISKGEDDLYRWIFKTPKKGEFNKDWLSVGSGSEPKSYSAQIYRGFPGSLAVRGAMSSGLESVVPGVQFQADYWIESLFNSNSVFFQRLGLGAGYSKALDDFEIDGFGGALEQSSAHFDLLYRFSSGVRPLNRSWGVGLRYFNVNILGGERGDIDPTLYGLGLFWHSAPIGAIDSAVSAVPFFKHPKWMELSAYFYPVAMAEDFSLGLAFSAQARGRLMFSKRWFLDTSINYHFLSFRRKLFGGSASVVEGSVGLGFNF